MVVVVVQLQRQWRWSIPSVHNQETLKMALICQSTRHMRNCYWIYDKLYKPAVTATSPNQILKFRFWTWHFNYIPTVTCLPDNLGSIQSGKVFLCFGKTPSTVHQCSWHVNDISELQMLKTLNPPKRKEAWLVLLVTNLLPGGVPRWCPREMISEVVVATAEVQTAVAGATLVVVVVVVVCGCVT